MALPLLLCALAIVSAVNPARADTSVTLPGEAGHLDGGARLFLANPDGLDAIAADVPAAAGGPFPKTGASFLLYGGGATIVPGPLRVQMSGWTGSLQANAGSKSTTWELSMGTINLEQRYNQGSFEVTGGIGVDYGQFTGALDDAASGQLNRMESNLWGYSATAGLRWPAQSRLAFFLRTGYEWLQGDGVWHGALASEGRLGASHVNLDGPSATLQVELGFQ